MKLSHIRRLRRYAALTIGAVTIAASLAACSAGSGSTAATSGSSSSAAPYRVGVLLGLTGSYAALGQPEQQAIDLYFKDLNKRGGIDGHKVVLVPLDSQSDEGTAVNQLRKLAVQDNVVAVLGPSSSGEGIALQPFTLSLKVPTIVLASDNTIVTPAAKAKYIFMQYTPTFQSLQAQLEYAKAQGWTKVGLLYSNDGYGQNAATNIDKVASQVGVTVTGSQAFDSSATDVTAQLGKLGQGSPDTVLVWAVNPANAVVAKSAKSIAFKPVLFNSPGGGSAGYITDAGAAAANGTYVEGSAVLAPASLDKTTSQGAVTTKFITEFKAAYGNEPGQFAANGWDGSTLLENAISKAGNPNPSNVQATRDAIQKALANDTKDIVGVNAIYTFTPDFHGSTSLKGLAILKVDNGAFTVAKTF